IFCRSIELPSAAAFRRERAGLRRGPGLSPDVARSPLSILGCAARPPLNLKSNPKNSKPCPERNRTRLKLDRVALELVVKRWSLNAEELCELFYQKRDQRWNILLPLAQWRHFNLESIEPVIQI